MIRICFIDNAVMVFRQNKSVFVGGHNAVHHAPDSEAFDFNAYS